MSTLQADLSFSRRGLLKGGGALIVGFSMTALPAGAAPVARGAAAGPFDGSAIDTWIAIQADNTATIYLGKGEFGQGNTTGLLQIAADELDLDMAQVRSVQLDTNVTTNQGATTSSSSIERAGPQLRAAAAEARRALLNLASSRLGMQVGSLVVEKGVVSIAGHGAQSVSYGELLGDKPFNVKFTGTAPQKAITRYKLVGKNVPRVDIPAKAAGIYTHLQHVRVPGMLHGRVVRPRGQRAYGLGAKALAIDEGSIKDIPARVVRKGDFVGVVAENEWDAIRASRAVKVTWESTDALPGNADLFTRMRAAKTSDVTIVNWGDAESAFPKAAHVASATYYCPYQSHAPFGPNCAVADVTAQRALVMSSTQDIYNTREMLAEVLGVPEQSVRVQYVEGSGTYGRSCYDDCAQAAAVMSQAVGKPVRVQFMRSDEHGWDDYGPAHLAEVRAGIDADGRIVAYEYQGWQHGWMINETTHELVLQTPPKERTTGPMSIPVNRMSTGSMYQIAHRRVVSHMVPMVGMLKGAPLRSPLDLSFAFASEQTIDELAVAAKMDPLEFRRRNIGDARWAGVLNAAAEAAGWKAKVAGSDLQGGDVVNGRGIGLGTHHVSYGAAVADIEVNKRTGVIVVKRLFGALDCGQCVNPAAVEAQIMGQMMQATSRTLLEEVLFDREGVTSLDWRSYPVLRFAAHPDIVPVVVQRLDEPSSGAGEEVMGATTAAIANAFYDATGMRLRQYPMTPERVKVGLAART
ncbi:MAG: molybdopterin cofactor-binding domain-containing protein [Xanthobacteraceae bacterium]